MEHRVHAGAFELQGLSGVSLACGSDVLGIRLGVPHVSLGLFDDDGLLYTLDPPDTYAPDLSYVRYSWLAPITTSGVRRFATWPRQGVNAPFVCEFGPGEAVRIMLEWYFDGETAWGRYVAEGPVRAALMANGCFAPAVVVVANAEACYLAQGKSVLYIRLRGELEEPCRVDTRQQAEQAWAGLEVKGKAMALYPVTLGPETPLYFTMQLHPKGAVVEPASLLLDDNEIDERLERDASAYEASRMRSTGICDGGAEAVAGLAGYSRAFDPKRKCLQTTVNRTWGRPNAPGLIFGWDNFFCSYLASWENPALGAASLEHIVSVYAEHGIAHGPVQRNLVIPVLYARTLHVIGDEGLARRTWRTMMEFMRFWFGNRGDGRPWRDGNGDGLIEAGTSGDPLTVAPGALIQQAMDETGYDEFPVYSGGFTNGRRGLLAEGVNFDWPSQTLTVTLIGQNSLYCAACRAMRRWAQRLDMTVDAEWLRAEELRVATRIRDRLYCEIDGAYRDRFWNGEFSPVNGMTLFYPLLAGIASEEVKERLKEMLLDPHQFWGEHVIPTVSRDDPTYCDGVDGRGNYWRGNIWPPTTYIVYLAIKEAGWEDVAADYAKRACAQFLRYWNAYGHAYENYPPQGEVDHRALYPGGWGGREIRYVWAAMMLLCGLEEVFGPEALRPGVHFGNPHLSEATSWTGFRFAGVPVAATAGSKRTHVIFGDRWEFLAEPGLAVREFVQARDGARFSADTAKRVRVRYRARMLPAGSTVLVDDQPAAAEVQQQAISFALTPGQHVVKIVREK